MGRLIDEFNRTLSTTSGSDETVSETYPAGTKIDKGKPPIFRGVVGLFPHAVRYVATVAREGTRRHPWDGFIDVDDGYARFSDALCRHLVSEAIEERDSETGLLHAGHVAWNALVRLELLLREQNDSNPERN